MGARGRGSYHFFDEAAGPYYGSQPQTSLTHFEDTFGYG